MKKPGLRRFLIPMGAVLSAIATAGMVSAGETEYQRIDWDHFDYQLPAESHFGEKLAISRTGAVLLVTAPNDGAQMGYLFEPIEGWYAVPSSAFYDQVPQLPQVASDTQGVAFTQLEKEKTAGIMLQLAAGPVHDVLVGGIPGPVTALAKDGDRIAVGESDFAAGAGRVQVFERIGDSWELTATFLGSAGAGLGRSLALEGVRLVAGAPGEGDCGAVHFFVDVGPWVDLQTIECPSQVQLDADFGATVVLAGTLLAVGAPRLDRFVPGGVTYFDAGGVYTFLPSGLLFELESFLRPPDAQAGDRFGSSLALYAAADSPNRALVAGSPLRDNFGLLDTGSVYMYLDWGDAWRLQASIDYPEDDVGVRFGASVAVGWMGIVIGAPRQNWTEIDEGVVYAYNGWVPLFYDGFDRGDLSAWSSASP